MSGRLRSVSVGVVCLVLLVAVTPEVSAQFPRGLPATPAQPRASAVASDLPPSSLEWGIVAPIAYVVPGWTFTSRRGVQDEFYADGYMYIYGPGWGNFDQTIHLPTGALFDGVTIFYFDADASANMDCNVYRMTGTSATGLATALLLADSTQGSTGYQGGYHALAAPETVRNVDPESGNTNMYLVDFNFGPSGTATALRFGGVTAWYRLQISPAPATASFSDVPTGYWAFRHIEALAASGITAGCGAGNFCPESTVTRAEMAVFLAKALGLHWPDAYLQ